MSQIKQLVSENLDDGQSDPFYYPGEEVEELKQAYRQNELSHYSTEELQKEIWRREESPIQESLTNLKAMVNGWNHSLDSDRSL